MKATADEERTAAMARRPRHPAERPTRDARSASDVYWASLEMGAH